ncbi:MAG: carbamoyltransferase [Deltaproteobacteria bacterium]|nr:carbamoyltransferase [Deltaproteobacteria bacterium]MBW1736128.1 carbamoyltransferase [Deltaproteobacteria bacterium]MBW1908456.1 carbamoyltransferase [Deltaproteobacteria bacterium]MBW2032507.1 carbamoyltransferase [Deltaproteobacteria bacterium]MBW2113434.1 carbamoyltransferase [Deltaproteobacteria bacterium]
MDILGISCFYHDSAACIVREGNVLAAAQEERFSRKKHDARFPKNAIKYCLEEGRITAKDLDYIVFYDKPFLTFERLLMSYLTVAPRGLRSWLESMPLWLGQKLHIPDLIGKETDYEGVVLFTEHHEAHAASAFYPSPFKEAAILTIDGVGEWASASCGFGSGRDITLLKELHFPDSVGLLYSAFTYFTGFRVNSGEYKLMGLAPYGKPVYRDIILTELIDLKEDGSIRLNLSYFDFLGGMRMTNKRFSRLFGGPPRKPETEITQREMDMAASIQSVTEEIVLKMARHVYDETHLKDLCMAGGVALNCVANGRILREGPFENIWIQPAAGDAGGALGAALSVWYRYLDNERIASEEGDNQQGSYLGPSFSNGSVRDFLERHRYAYRQLEKGERAKVIAEQIAAGKIVGYMAGRMEFGPRALGARSILGDPRREDIQSVMNLKIKYRESFRPFAPSVLEEKASKYFEIDRPSPYMLLVAGVREERRLSQVFHEGMSIMDRLKIKRSDIPAVTHLDYSARLQTVSKKYKPDYYEVISEFEKLTGCAVVVNTSFNVRGEPIICSPEDAYRCFMRTEMDVLIMEDCILFKEEQVRRGEKGDWHDEPELD